jgi:hypothetical protein
MAFDEEHVLPTTDVPYLYVYRNRRVRVLGEVWERRNL